MQSAVEASDTDQKVMELIIQPASVNDLKVPLLEFTWHLFEEDCHADAVLASTLWKGSGK